MKKKIAMIGVGKLGEPCAEAMSQYHDVVGYDVLPRTPIFKMKDTIAEAVEDRDIIFVAAPTPHDPKYDGRAPSSHLDNKDFDYTIVKSILEEVNKSVTKKQIVVLISTVLPGTVRRELRPLINNARFVYNPYLIAMGTVKWDFLNPEMVMLGTDDGSETGDAKIMIDFYKTMMENNPRYIIGTWDECECIKVFYNTFISTKLSLVNMIQDVAEKQGNINVDVVTDALAQSDQRIMGPKYMTAGMGDGGACHPRDNIALRFMADNLELNYDLFDAVMKAREIQAENMAKKLVSYGKPIIIVGKAYKPNVKYIDGSYSILVGHYVEQLGQKLFYHDPLCGENGPETDGPYTYLIAHDPDVAFLLSKRPTEGEDITIQFQPGSTIVDPWRKMKDVNDCEVVHYGNTRISNQKTPLILLDEMAVNDKSR
jgi:UDPglucose 6-dehydrogenase|tara:strand:- start:10345 stop:11622 length:1278 start_codon:yes stop_codon:yes gene_type:complete